MRTRSRGDFTTIRTEGQILPPDLLTRIIERDSDLEGLDPGSYHLAGQTINEAISRSWTVLQGVWVAFKERRAVLPEGQPETGMTRERWLLPLFRELDYGRLETMQAAEIEGKSYPISHRWRHAPIHLVGFRTDLDKRTPGVAGAARISPHGLVQEYLNRTDNSLWAFLSDGLRLRILRDNASLTRQAYVEFDLEAMMDGEVYPDFVLLWLLCHQSRVEADRPEECHLEKWSHAAAQRGTRALEGLREGVEKAISALGSGFLSHRANDELKSRLRSGELDTQDYYRQLLRLVYRLLFLFVAEDRGLLLDPHADDAAKDRYIRFYSTRKLRAVAEKRIGARHSDLYQALSLVMDRLGDERGCPELGLPALGSFLFSREAMPDLTGAEVSNRELLEAVRALSYTVVDGAYRAVDYKNLGAEELGSVYESLLELQPDLDSTSGTFTLRAVTGNERKTTGSYYTPHSLVTSLLDTALDPVLDEAARKPDPEKAILDLKVCDPAVGSGHFLIAAAHRMAKRLASVRTGDDEPSPEATREALRDVIGRCLYGVDVNPTAAELCRVSLWMEALVPGRPLSFLDHHIQVGNSLLGTTPDLISDGIPDDAFKRIEGDDKQLTSAYRKRNREEREAWRSGQLSFSLRTLDKDQEAIERGYEEVEETEEDSVAAVQEKAARYAALRESDEMFHARRLADAWCAAFMWPKQEGAPDAITQGVFAHLAQDAYALAGSVVQEIGRIANLYNLFHWHLGFPNVFSDKGGFDVILGNPPWERVNLKKQEWFAARRPEIAEAPNAATRNEMIQRLVTEDPALHSAFESELRMAGGQSHFMRVSGRYPLCGRGDINTYAVFAELNRTLLNSQGRVGMIVPDTIATNKTTAAFFKDLVSNRALKSLYGFKNERFLFVGVEHTVTFALMTLGGASVKFDEMEFCWLAWTIEEMMDETRRIVLSPEDIQLLNPNTLTCPVFRTRRDAEIATAIYRRVPVFLNENHEGGDPWKVTLRRMLHMADDSNLFRVREELEDEGCRLDGNVFLYEGGSYLPLYEAKMLHQYDHRWATYADSEDTRDFKVAEKADPNNFVMPRYWVPEREIAAWFSSLWRHNWFFGWRDICRNTDERTLISTFTPFSGISGFLMIFPEASTTQIAALLAILNSFCVDYCARQKMGGTHMTYFTMQQLPILSPSVLDTDVTWQAGIRVDHWIARRVLELVYTAWDLTSLARDLGYEGPPFHWDSGRRFLLRCELDAAFFHLYGIGRDDVNYIMDTFLVFKRRDEDAHGEYRTKRVILEIYDQMVRAAETGQPYQTSLDPPLVRLDLPSGESASATVTSLRPPEKRSYPQSEESRSASKAAEEMTPYGQGINTDTNNSTRGQLQSLADTTLEGKDSTQPSPEHRRDADEPAPDQSSNTSLDATLFPDHEVETKYTIPSIEEAALALHACVLEGEKVQRETLLLDAARELGHTKLTRKVRRALNQAINSEHNAGRLRTNWERVWKPRKK
jgi:N-6 DNA Methylase/Eco57I restriction-modification methylase